MGRASAILRRGDRYGDRRHVASARPAHPPRRSRPVGSAGAVGTWPDGLGRRDHPPSRPAVGGERRPDIEIVGGIGWRLGPLDSWDLAGRLLGPVRHRTRIVVRSDGPESGSAWPRWARRTRVVGRRPPALARSRDARRCRRTAGHRIRRRRTGPSRPPTVRAPATAVAVCPRSPNVVAHRDVLRPVVADRAGAAGLRLRAAHALCGPAPRRCGRRGRG